MEFAVNNNQKHLYKSKIKNRINNTKQAPGRNTPAKGTKIAFISTISVLAALGGYFAIRKNFGSSFIKNHINSKVNNMANTYSKVINPAEKTQPADNFINNFLKGADSETETVFKTHDFSQYGREGISLKYPRDKFIEDINKVLDTLPEKRQNEVLQQFNLQKGFDDIDGIPVISSKTDDSKEALAIKELIESFYHKNETTIADPSAKKAFDTVINGFPEFNMTIGKVQHGTHIYSVDIHSLTVLQKSMQNPSYLELSDESKEVLKLTALIHDFGKKGNVITKGHAAISREDAELFIDNYKLPQNIKDRVLKQVENHHWFELYNKGIIDGRGVVEIFKTPEDLEVAKILAKADFESVSPEFHLYMMNRFKVLTQQEFDREFASKMGNISIDKA